MKKGLTLTVVLLVIAAVLAVWGFVDKGNLQKQLDAKTAEHQTALDTVKAEADTKVAQATSDLEAAKAEAQTKASELTAQIATLTADLETAKTDAQTSTGELTTQVANLTAELEAAKAGSQTNTSDLTAQIATLTADLETAKADAQTKTDEVTSLTAELEAAKAAIPENKYGLGMVTSIGSVAEATAEKPGAAQVNTTVASLVLDKEGKIVSVTWDVQQTKIQFSLEGKPVDLPTEMLTKLEKGASYGMIKASQIGKEWNEQIEAFAQYAVGKTVDEVLNIPVVQRDESHPAVPDVEELKASVSISVGDYLASLKKAAENAK